MRHTFFHTPRYLFLLLLGILLSAALVVPLPPRAKAQQGRGRQLTQDETEKASGKRIALVIGNGAYTNAPRLKNPPNDATDIADALSRLGFTVDHGVDLNQKQMKYMIREFGKKLKAGGQGVFYYAGHGVQSKGHNYLIPVDASIESEADVEDQGVDVQLMLNYMDDAQNGLNIVILDACRNNPFARSLRSAESGLAQVDAPTGTLIAYSTAPGRVAQDGEGRNGTYTAELLKEMRVAGVSVTEMFMRVRAEVVKETGGKQVPWEASSLIGSFAFNTAAGNATSAANNAGNAASKPSVALADAGTVEAEYWETIKNSTSAADYEAYLKEYPQGRYAQLARLKVRQMEAARSSRENNNASVSAPTGGNKSSSTTTSGTKPAPGIGTDPGLTANRVIGQVASVNTIAKQVIVKTDTGAIITVLLDETSTYLRTQPGATNLDGAITILLTDIIIGDRIYARGAMSGDQKYIKARQLIVMARSNQPSSTVTSGAKAAPRTGAIVRNQMGMELAYIPAGTFMMGSPASEAQRSSDEGPQHQVTIREGFYMGRYEVTQAQYQEVTGNNPSDFKNCDQCPVEQVSWNDAQEFIRRLNARNDGYTYRLPSEAEWEYACRAGTTTAFAFGDSLSPEQANFNGNYPYGGAAKGVYREKTTPVGSFQPNGWGLYDMHGNVWEWCEDWYHDSYIGAPTDGSAWESGGEQKIRVLRGGSWDYDGSYLRSAYRSGRTPGDRSSPYGFRVVALART